MKIETIKKIIVSLVFVFAVSFSFAQQAGPSDPPGGGGGPGEDDPPVGAAPISGGLFILLTAGLAYGGKKLYNLKSENEEQIDS